MTIPLTPAPKGEVTLKSKSSRCRARSHRTTTKPATRSTSNRTGGREDRLPRPGRNLHRGRAAGGAPRGRTSSRCARATVHDAILAVERGEAERALVPFENSIEGSVRSTLDTLAFDTEAVTIVGEHDFTVHAHLIAREPLELERDRGGALPPAAAGPVRPLPARELPGVERRSVSSTAEAVRMVGESARALGGDRRRVRRPSSTAARSSREGIEDEADNVTRFVWIAPAGTEPAGGGAVEDLARLLRARRGPPGRPGRRAAGVLQPRGQPDAGSSRGPLRQGLGRYMFFCDLEGGDRASRPCRGDRGAADQGRIGADPGLLPGRLERVRLGTRLRRIPEQHGTCARTQCDV